MLHEEEGNYYRSRKLYVWEGICYLKDLEDAFDLQAHSSTKELHPITIDLSLLPIHHIHDKSDGTRELGPIGGNFEQSSGTVLINLYYQSCNSVLSPTHSRSIFPSVAPSHCFMIFITNIS